MRLVKADRRMRVKPEEVDAHSWLLACPDGYVDEDGNLQPHDPSKLFTECMLMTSTSRLIARSSKSAFCRSATMTRTEPPRDCRRPNS